MLEAMRFRKPVVATAAPGTTEVVVEGETGLLVPVGDVTGLARSIRDLVRDPPRDAAREHSLLDDLAREAIHDSLRYIA